MPASELPANAFGQQHRKRPLPPIDWLRERFEYDPDTGIIWHRKRDLLGNRKRADNLNKTTGYHLVALPTTPRQNARAHRLAFALITGRWPTMIDHIDRDKANNIWTNLREVTTSENVRNRKASDCAMLIHKTSKTKHKQGFAWRIQIRSEKSRRTTARRDFCAAWKVRQAWLAKRNAG